jgi:hypothetical protein
MVSRRTLELSWLAAVFTSFPETSNAQSQDRCPVRIRADESVRSLLPPIAQQNLAIMLDQSAVAREMAARAPPERAAPIILIIVGAIALVKIVEMIHELGRELYYGGVIIDGRKSPPEISNDVKIPPGMVFVFQADGSVKQFRSDDVPAELIATVLRGGK